MKALIRHIILVIALGLLQASFPLYGQINHDDYINSSTDKKEFSEKQWKKLKGKMKSESSGNSANGDDFNNTDFNTSEGVDGDYYDYEQEDYKGEYSEYQNYEDYENTNYEHDEYDYYDSYSNDNYSYDDPDKSGEFDYYEKPVEYSPPKSNSLKNDTNVSMGSGTLTVMQMILVTFGIALLVFLIYRLFMRYQSEKDGAVVEANFDDMAPSEIPKTELERRLEEALGRGDYREAVRIYFIFIIKDLSDKNWIKWEKRKTNISYLIEMRSRPQYDLFNRSISVFEVVWYGNYAIDQKSFEEVEPTFKQLLNSIHSKQA